MDAARNSAAETITLKQAKKLVQCMAHEQSLLFLSPPGVGKSEMVYQAAHEAGLPCRSLLGTQIAPEDVSGIPRIVGERSVFCPPRLLLPERPEPFCLFLDELPACAPDVQKAFYSLLLERRLGEHDLPHGTWVVAAGNRMQDRALVRAMSSALVNRVTILHLRVDADEWQDWAARNGVRSEIRSFVAMHAGRADAPGAGRAGAVLDPARLGVAVARSRHGGNLRHPQQRDAPRARLRPAVGRGRRRVLRARRRSRSARCGRSRIMSSGSSLLPKTEAARWFILNCIRQNVRDGKLSHLKPRAVNRFLRSLTPENQLTLLTDLVEQWGALGADRAMFDLLKKVTAL